MPLTGLRWKKDLKRLMHLFESDKKNRTLLSAGCYSEKAAAILFQNVFVPEKLKKIETFF